jgi:glycosyltransferase A (GT-A) superfamily protein (DUF2064 family)
MPRRAILIFARSARAEAHAKGLPQLEGVFSAVAAAWIRAAARCGATAILASDQRGTSFGERLANAAADAFVAGFETLLVTGIDTPPLRSLETAFSAVESGQVAATIAPSTDGGINAIVLQCENSPVLASFAPRDPHLARRCIQHFGGRVLLLPSSTDIDSAASLRLAQSELVWRPFLANAILALQHVRDERRVFVHVARPLRAPPLAA